MSPALLCLGAALLAAPPAATRQKPAEAPARRVALRATLVVKVVDRDATAEALIAAAEARQGYFSQRTDDAVDLRLPAAELDAMIAQAEAAGVVVTRTREAEDVGGHLDELRTLLGSRQEVLKRYDAVLAGATASAVVSVETEMTALVHDIESLQGSIQQVEHQLRFAALTVQFEFRDRRPPVRDGTSSFDWLNGVNLQDLLWEFDRAP